MAEAPGEETTVQAVRRRENGTFSRGQSGNPGGNKALPECFRSLEPALLGVLAAMATGEVLEPLFEGHPAALAAAREAATETGGKLRLEAIDKALDRIRGRPKEQVDVTATTREIKAIELHVVRAEPKQVETVDVKQIGKADAE